MYLKVIRGLEQAKRDLQRVDPLELDSIPPEVLRKTHELFGEKLSAQESVQRILRDVRQQGDSAVKYYTKQLDGVDVEEFTVSDQDIDGALQRVPRALVKSLKLAAGRIEEFHRATLRKRLGRPFLGSGRNGDSPGAGGRIRAWRDCILPFYRADDCDTGQGGRC